MSDKFNQERRQKWLQEVGLLSEALPFMRRYAGAVIVIKYGGHVMGNPELAKQFAHDIVLLKQVGINPVIVHGGGPSIGSMLAKISKKTEFIDGFRVTDHETLEIAEMVLAGKINKEIVSLIQRAGGLAVGISGKDGNLIQAEKMTRTKIDPDSNIEKLIDLGFVGQPQMVNTHLLNHLSAADFIPIVAPIGADEKGQTLNINADTAAGAIAAAMGAKRFILMTDIEGVLDKDGELLSSLTKADVHDLIGSGVIHGGMIPKVQTCIEAVDHGAEGSVILDGRIAHALLLELFTEMGSGTYIG